MRIANKVKCASFFLGLFVLLCGTVWAQASAGQTSVPAAEQPAEKKAGNPVIDIPGGVLGVLYGGFDGFGSMFDGFVTGDKPPGGSNQGKQDPEPLRSFQGRYGQLMQFDYGVEGTNRFANESQEQ